MSVQAAGAAPGFPWAPGVVLVACTALFAVACRRRWTVPVWMAVLVALAVRLAVGALSYGHTPNDVATYFRHAGQLVMAGHEPATGLPRFQWNFLPLMPFVYALEIGTGLPWQVGGKIAPILADVLIVALLAKLVPERHAGTAPLLYALCPVAVLVSAEHGQVEPVALALGIGGLLLARRGATVRSGLLAGLAIATKTWPVLLVVGMLRETPWRRWWRLLLPAIAALAVLLATVPLFLHTSLRAFTHVLGSYRSFLGLWGWTGILRFFHVTGIGYQGPNVDVFQRIGTGLLAGTLIVVVIAFRRADGVALTAAVLLAFLVVTAGFGPQYLVWPVPFVLALRRPAGLVFVLAASCYAAFAYFVAIPHGAASWAGPWQQWLSVPVIASAVTAMPWFSRRAVPESPPPESTPGTAEQEPASPDAADRARPSAGPDARAAHG